MNNKQEVRVYAAILLAALLLATTPLVAANYEEDIQEKIFLVRPDNQYLANYEIPTYLEDEDLTFFGCTEQEQELDLSVVCQDTNEFKDVSAMRWGDSNCYIGHLPLEELSCSQAVAQAEYTELGENRRIQQQININKFSQSLNRIVETQFSDGGWENELDTAHGLFVLSQYPNLFEEEIQQAIDYLKLNRNEQDKCWPQDECQASTTANILYLLEQSPLTDLRIQHDARLYLQREHNYIPSGAQWEAVITDHTLNLNNSFNTSCVYEYKSNTEAFSLPKHPQSVQKELQPTYGETINIACTQPVFVDLYDERDNTRFRFQGSNFTYNIPPACWTLNSEFINCDIKTSLWSMNTNIDSNQKNAARNYLQTLLIPDPTAGSHIGENWTIANDALYAQAQLQDAEEIITSLLYQQSNSGSWTSNTTYYQDTYFQPTDLEQQQRPERLTDNVTQQIVNTGYVVLALLANEYDRNAEPIQDAERWVSLYEDEIGFNPSQENLTDEDFAQEYEENKTSILTDPKRNAMAFAVLQNNARPLLRTNPGVLVVTGQNTTVDVINPTIFDIDELEYTLSDNLEGIIEVEEKDFVGAYSYRRIQINRVSQEQDFGYLRIHQEEDEYLKLPIIVTSKPEADISLPEEIIVFGREKTLPFSVSLSDHDFTCDLVWEQDNIESRQPFDISNQQNGTYQYPIRFDRSETENELYNANITCVAQGITIRNPIVTNFVRFPRRPLRVAPRAVSILEANTPAQVELTNQLDEPIDVTTTLETPDPYIQIATPQLALAPGETRNISIQVVPVSGENHTATNYLQFEALGVQEEILLDVEVYPPPPNYALFGAIAVLLIALIGAGYLAYTRRDDIVEFINTNFRKENIKQQVQEEIQQLEQEELHDAIRNMMRIYKLQGLKDTEVQKKLLEQGYTQEEIDQALHSQQETAATQEDDSTQEN